MKKYCTNCFNALQVDSYTFHKQCTHCKEYVVLADTQKQAKKIHKTMVETAKNFLKELDEKTKNFINSNSL